MIGRLNHLAIVVPDLAAAAARYRDALGAEVSAPLALPEHGVTVVFVDLPNSKIELVLVGNKVLVTGQAHDIVDATNILRVVRAHVSHDDTTK